MVNVGANDIALDSLGAIEVILTAQASERFKFVGQWRSTSLEGRFLRSFCLIIHHLNTISKALPCLPHPVLAWIYYLIQKGPLALLSEIIRPSSKSKIFLEHFCIT